MTKNPLAVVGLLAFIFGGAAAVMLYYPPRHAVVSQQFAETPADPAPEDAPAARPAEVADAEEETTSEDFDDPAVTSEGGLSETGAEAEDGSSESDAEAEKSSNGVRRRQSAVAQTVQSAPAPRPYVRVSRRGTNPGARVAGYTVGGVKKTGQGVKKAGTAIGRTFGKIGGVFN